MVEQVQDLLHSQGGLLIYEILYHASSHTDIDCIWSAKSAYRDWGGGGAKTAYATSTGTATPTSTVTPESRVSRATSTSTAATTTPSRERRGATGDTSEEIIYDRGHINWGRTSEGNSQYRGRMLRIEGEVESISFWEIEARDKRTNASIICKYARGDDRHHPVGWKFTNNNKALQAGDTTVQIGDTVQFESKKWTLYWGKVHFESCTVSKN